MPEPRQSPKKTQLFKSPERKPESPFKKPEILEKKPIRQYGAMTMEESVKHISVETEQVEAAPDLQNKGTSNVSDMNAAYGY